jgi:hypothetical protein
MADGIGVPLGILTRAEAHALLSVRVGTERIAAEPRAGAELVELCGLSAV